MSDSPIAAIELHHVALPTRREHKWTGLTEPIGGYVLVKMTDDDGNAGWGEAPALKDWGGEFGRYFGESPGTTIEVDHASSRAGREGLHARRDCANCTRAWTAASRAIPTPRPRWSSPPTISPGGNAGLPVHRLLGGAVRRRIPVTHSIGLLGFEEAEREVAQVAREGIRTIKIKVGVDPDRDVEMVRRIRETVGPGDRALLRRQPGLPHAGRSDPHLSGAWSDYDLIYFEQPVEGIERLAEVARAIDAPVMADESAWNAHDVIQIIEKRAAQIVSIYTTKPGGLYRAMEVAAVARAAGIICNVNGSVETGIGNLANLALAAAAPAVVLSCVVPVSTPAEAQSRADRRHLLQGRPDCRADALRRWRDRAARRARHGHRCRRGQDQALRASTAKAVRAACARM